MSAKVLSLIISILANVAIATYVLSRGYNKTVNRSLSILVYSFASWSLFTLLVTVSKNVHWVSFFGHCCFAIGILLPIAILYFAIVFPKPPLQRNKLQYGIPALNYVIIVTGAVLFFLSFTELIQKGVYFENGVFRPAVGILHPVYVVHIILSAALGLSYLFKKWKLAKVGIETIQLKTLFTGIFLSAFLAIITNAVLPALGFAQFVSIGPTFTVIIVGFIAYSIVRYHLFDITIVVKKTVIYAILTGFITALYIVGVLVAERFFRGIVGYKTFFPAVFAALIVAFVFLPLRQKVQKVIDRVFYRKKYEYQSVLKKTGKALARVLSLSQLLDMILTNVTESVGIEKASILLKEKDRYCVASGVALTEERKRFILRKNSSLVTWIERRQEVVIREDLERLRSTGTVREMSKILNKIGAEIAIPILRERVLTGIIFLSGKQSGDIFTQEDIDLFLTLANQASVAIDNAKLYTRVEEARVYQENILRNLTGGVITIDRKRRIVIFNEKAQELTGFSSQVIGKPFEQVAKGSMSRLAEDVLEHGKGYAQQKVDYPRAEDISIPLAVSTAPLKDAGGNVNGVVVVLVDLTEIEHLEQELYQAEKLASLGTLAAGMAHEIKNPLVAINTFLQLLPSKFDDEQFRGEFARVAASEVERINNIVEQLLDFSHPKPIDYQLINVHDVIDATLVFLSTQLNKKSIKIVKDYAADIPDIHADEDRLKQVFLNLFLNGIEDMGSKDAFTIRTYSNFRNNGKSISEGGELIIEVRDTGKGIPPDILPNIFDPFFSTKEKGTGLGLAVVHRIIADHDGMIRVKESEVGKGTCFSLHLPFNRKDFAQQKSVNQYGGAGKNG